MNMDGGPYQEYFYIELPVSVSNIESNGKDGIYTVVRKRFVYVHEDTGERFPMQFGPEVSLTAHFM